MTGRWSLWEQRKLNQLWHTASKAELAAALSSRSDHAIRRRAYEQGMRRRRTCKNWDKLPSLIQDLVLARLSKGLTQPELAERIGTTLYSVRDWEIGRHTPSLPFLLYWAEALEMDLMARPKSSVQERVAYDDVG